VFSGSAWLAQHNVISRGPVSYKIVDQQTDAHHYYVWVRRIESAGV
jgi:hypothetical protein